jgi:site-specific recombinase XerD
LASVQASPSRFTATCLGIACGYALANAGHDTRALQDWLGHRSIQHTVRYTALSPTRFQDFWR